MDNLSWLPGLAKEALVFLSGLSIVGIVLNQIGAARERQRQEYAKALQTAVRWGELPYRVHRRKDNEPETKAALAEAIHGLQEEFGFYDAWLSVEAPHVAEKYRRLRQRVKDQAKPHIQAAWDATPEPDPKMNIGDLYQVDFAAEQAEFVKAVGLHLAWFGFFEWFRRGWEWIARKGGSIRGSRRSRGPSGGSAR